MERKRTTEQRLAALREVMQRERLGAFIVADSSPHGGRQVADHWRGCQWLCGTEGIAAVTMDEARRWELPSEGLAALATVGQWVADQLRDTRQTEVGIDGMACSAACMQQLIGDMRRVAITVRTNLDPLARIWADRPALPARFPQGGEGAGRLADIRQALRRQHADGMLVSDHDDVAWALGVQGRDDDCRPLFAAYLLVASTRATLFTHQGQLSPTMQARLEAEGIDMADYADVRQGLRDYFEYNILLDPAETCHTLMTTALRPVVRATSPLRAMRTNDIF